jgi:hypothetical protein
VRDAARSHPLRARPPPSAGLMERC